MYVAHEAHDPLERRTHISMLSIVQRILWVTKMRNALRLTCGRPLYNVCHWAYCMATNVSYSIFIYWQKSQSSRVLNIYLLYDMHPNISHNIKTPLNSYVSKNLLNGIACIHIVDIIMMVVSQGRNFVSIIYYGIWAFGI